MTSLCLIDAAGRTTRQRGPIRLAGRFVILFVLLSIVAAAQEPYKRPPKEILDVLNASGTPGATLNPSRDYILLAEGVRYPPITELAQPMLRLAGMRINPELHTLHRTPYYVKLKLVKVADGSTVDLKLPPDPRVGFPAWSPDGKHFVFSNTTAAGVELWVGDVATATPRLMKGVRINAAYGPAAFGPPARWLPDNSTVVVPLLLPGSGKTQIAAPVSTGPKVQESIGKAKPARTFPDLLQNRRDEDLFDELFTSQLALLDTKTGKSTLIGEPAVFQTLDPSPNGKFLLVTRVHRPYSYTLPHTSFPKDVEVWDTHGKVKYKVASLPLADQVPAGGVPAGPRIYNWQATAAATLFWVEALDGGNTKEKAAYRDRVVTLEAPFQGTPKELTKTVNRVANLQWGDSGDVALVTDYDRDKRWLTTTIVNLRDTSSPGKALWSLSVDDRYNNPGSPLMRTLPNGYRAFVQHGDWIYLSGPGASPEGDRPFLDRLNLNTRQTEHLFRSDKTCYEAAIALLDDQGTSLLTRRETPTQPLNLYVRNLAAPAGESVVVRASMSSPEPALLPLTHFEDPTPQLRSITKQLVTYKRADGVQLSFTLYLPPGYREGTRLPTVLWAYPVEFNDASTAGQVSGSTQRFTTFTGASQLFFLLAGYAVLDNATMPIVGDPATVNNTFVEQIVMNAQAAVNKAVEMGVADPERIGVAGHSYGAFMTANLLAHSDLFRAGIALSGAYNRTLTPFGFQNEQRNLWEAPSLYIKVSPFMSADKIKDPLLLIHGEADENEGTFPMQSERLYQAISGLGGTVRLVTLPYEAHIYEARESTEDTLSEMIEWFDKYVKNAPARVKSESRAGQQQ